MRKVAPCAARQREPAETPFLRARVAERHKAPLSAWKDRAITLGVRPEHLSINAADRNSIGAAEIEVIEQLGSEIVLETRLGDSTMTIARVDPQLPLAVGETVQLSVPSEQLHFFDPETEQAIR